MQFLNRIELKGIVGRVNVTETTTGKIINFAVVTEYAYRDSQNLPTVEVQWSNVIYTGKSEYIPAKGEKIHIIGRITTRRYVDADGIERTMTQVVAKEINKILPQEEVLEYENAENL